MTPRFARRVVPGRLAWPVLATAVLLAPLGCPPADEPDVLAMPAEPSIALINATPGDYVGQPVNIVAAVRVIRQPGVFVVGPAESPTGEEILVLRRGAQATGPEVAVNDIVRVVGTVRLFRPELATETGPTFDSVGPAVDPVFYATWRNRPVIVAEAVSRLQYPLP